MANNSKNARDLGLKRLRKPGSATDAHLVQWRAIDAAERVLYKAAEVGNIGTVLQAVNALTQATQAYARLADVVEFQKRLEALEAAEAARSNPNMKRVV